MIDAIRGGDGEENLREQGVDVFREHARFVDGATVVAGDHRLCGDQLLIATGASAKVPPITGLARAVT